MKQENETEHREKRKNTNTFTTTTNKNNFFPSLGLPELQEKLERKLLPFAITDSHVYVVLQHNSVVPHG